MSEFTYLISRRITLNVCMSARSVTREHMIEVDDFHGALAGLCLAEIELRSEDDEITPPPFLGKEVTGDPRFSNSDLALAEITALPFEV